MKIKNDIAIVREKLDNYQKPYIEVDLLQKILNKFAPNYTIANLSHLWLITLVKRGKVYINNKTHDFINPFVVWNLYMWDEIYCFGWLWVYNRYSLTEQIAEWLTIYNTKVSGKKVIWNNKFIFKRQRKSFFYWIKKEKFENCTYNIMTIERAFIEMLKEWKTFGELPYWIDKKKLQSLANKYASKKIISLINKLCI